MNDLKPGRFIIGTRRAKSAIGDKWGTFEVVRFLTGEPTSPYVELRHSCGALVVRAREERKRISQQPCCVHCAVRPNRGGKS